MCHLCVSQCLHDHFTLTQARVRRPRCAFPAGSWLGTTFTACLLTQWPGNWLVTPDTNANTPSGVIFKKSTSSLESSLSKSADITGKTEGLILFSHTLGTCKSYVFAVKGCISGTPCIRVSLLNLSQISDVKTNRWQKAQFPCGNGTRSHVSPEG